MIQIVRDQKYKSLQTLLDGIASVERRANIKVCDYMNFGNDSNANIQFWIDDDGDCYIGERNGNNKIQGKGICIYSDGTIRIGYFDNGGFALGNYLNIFSDGSFTVGEKYMLNGKKKTQCTQYDTDGRSRQDAFDR